MPPRLTAQSLALLVGAVFLLVGIVGFVPGITTHYGDMRFSGHDSGAKLLGLFQTSILHNLVHIAFGLVGLTMARTPAGARTFLIGGGLVYLALWLYGLVVDRSGDANFVPLNTADNWLHFVFGMAMVGLALAGRERVATTTAAPPPA